MKAKDILISRRNFIIALGGAWATISLSPAGLLAKERVALKRTIPSSGELLPVIGLGTSRTFDTGDNQAARSNLAEVLQTFFGSGGALIDSSPMYGSSERVIGELLKTTKNKSSLFAATKVWTDGEQSGIRQMEESSRLWGVNKFDLMQIHNLRDWKTHLNTLKGWKEQGKVRYIGITTSHGRSHAELEQIMQTESLDFVQFTYNIDNRSAEQRLLPLAADRGMATLINRPFQRGNLFGRVKGKPLPAWTDEFDCKSWGQYFLKFVVSHPTVTCSIPATSKVHHIVDNMAAGFGRLPDAEMRHRMIRHFESV
jgi:diketogulonate reductase-like aldo/keto reductase